MAKKKMNVEELLTEFKESKSTRFKKKDLERIVLAVLTDKGHKAIKKTYDLKGKTLKVEEVCMAEMFETFIDSILKAADIGEKERAQIIEKYEPKEKDIAFMLDAVEEAEYIYITEGNKALKKWAEKGFNLTIKNGVKKNKEATLKRLLKNPSKYEGELTRI